MKKIAGRNTNNVRYVDDITLMAESKEELKSLLMKVRAMLCYAMLSHFSRVRLCVTPRQQPTRLPRPWDSPGKNTGVGRHFPLQCMKVKRESEVAQSCLTLSDPMECSLPVSSVHGIFQARVLEWGANALCMSIHSGISFSHKMDEALGIP